MNNEMNSGIDQGNNRQDNRNNDRRAKKIWEPMASITPANTDPNFQDLRTRRDVHVQLNRTVPQDNGYCVHSASLSRVVEQEREDKNGIIPPRTQPYFGIYTEVIEGRVVPTPSTMQRAEDLKEAYLDAVQLVVDEKQEQYDRMLADKEERSERSAIRMGVQARTQRPVMRKNKTQKDKARRGGVVVDAPKQPEAHEQQD